MMTRKQLDTDAVCLQQITAALESTCSSDPDVLFARREELLADTRKMSTAATFRIIAGFAVSLTVVGAIVGVPAIRRGLGMRKRVAATTEAVESAYSAYLGRLADKRSNYIHPR